MLKLMGKTQFYNQKAYMKLDNIHVVTAIVDCLTFI